MIGIEVKINGVPIKKGLCFGDGDGRNHPDTNTDALVNAYYWHTDYLYNDEDAESVYAAEIASKTAPVKIEVVFPNGCTFSNRAKVSGMIAGMKADDAIVGRVICRLQGGWTKTNPQF